MQAQLIPVLAVLHNFIWIHNPSDIPEEEDDDQDFMNNENGLQESTGINDTGASFQEEIALRMWQDYQEAGYRHR